MDQMSRGYLAFDNGRGSNHRGIWIDIPCQNLFGAMDQQYILAKACKLKCLDPREVSKYNEHLEEALTNSRYHKDYTNFAIR